MVDINKIIKAPKGVSTGVMKNTDPGVQVKKAKSKGTASSEKIVKNIL